MFKNTFPNPGSIYLFKVNSRNIRKRSEICSKLPMKIPKRRHWGRSGVFIISYFKTFPKFSIVDFEQVNICWESDILFVWYLFQCVYLMKAGLNNAGLSNAGNSCYFSYFPYSVRCNLCKPSITQMIHSMKTGKFV